MSCRLFFCVLCLFILYILWGIIFHFMKFCAYLMTSESVVGHCWLASILCVLCIIVLLQLVDLPKQWMLQSAARPLYFYKFLVMCYIFLVYVAIVPLLIHYIKFSKFSSFSLRYGDFCVTQLTQCCWICSFSSFSPLSASLFETWKPVETWCNCIVYWCLWWIKFYILG